MKMQTGANQKRLCRAGDVESDDLTAFGRTAEVIAEFVKKGNPIFVEGRLSLDQWDDKQTGQKRSKIKVIAEGFQFCGAAAGHRASGGTGLSRVSRQRLDTRRQDC